MTGGRSCTEQMMSGTAPKRSGRARVFNNRNAFAAWHTPFTNPLVASYAADSPLTTRCLVMGVAGIPPHATGKVRHAFTIQEAGGGTGSHGGHGRLGSRRRDPGIGCRHDAAFDVDDD